MNKIMKSLLLMLDEKLDAQMTLWIKLPLYQAYCKSMSWAYTYMYLDYVQDVMKKKCQYV